MDIMVNPSETVFDILRGVTGLGEGLWGWMAFHPVIQNNPGISLIVASVILLSVKSRGSTDDRDSSGAIEQLMVDLLDGTLKILFHDLPKAFGSILDGFVKGIASWIRRIRESDNFSIVGGSLIDLSLISWKTIFLGILGLLGISIGAFFGWFNGLI
jgi:hypothetical protein